MTWLSTFIGETALILRGRTPWIVRANAQSCVLLVLSEGARLELKLKVSLFWLQFDSLPDGFSKPFKPVHSNLSYFYVMGMPQAQNYTVFLTQIPLMVWSEFWVEIRTVGWPHVSGFLMCLMIFMHLCGRHMGLPIYFIP